MNKDKICYVEGCTNPVYFKGLCNKHEIRMRRNGTFDLKNPPRIFETKEEEKEYNLNYMKKRREIERKERREYTRKWREKNKNKYLCHSIVLNAKLKGELNIKPCEICGNKKVHAHHDDYTKPLNIKWLCASCHGKLHEGVKFNVKEMELTD